MIVEAIISALIGLATEGAFSKAKERVILILKEKGFDVPPSNTFDGIYLHTLIEFGAGKPPEVIELFKHEFIQDAFHRAYEQNNTNNLIAEIDNLIDWHRVGKSFQELDIDPKTFVDEFAKTFHFIVDRTRTPYQVREENALDAILDNQLRHIEQTQYTVKLLEQMQPSVTGNVDESNISERIYMDRIEQARKLVKQGQSIAGKKILKELERELDGEDISRKLQYELCTNIASAHLHLEEYDDACTYLETALLNNKKEPKALANAALAALIRENYMRAIELAEESLHLDENQPTAISVLLQASKRESIELSDAIKQKAQSHTESRRIFAVFSFQEKDFEAAEKLCRENLSKSDSEVQDSILLAQTIIASEEEKISEGTHLLILPKTIQERLNEAEQLLITTKKEWEKDDNRKRFVRILGLLIQVQSLQRKNDLVWSNCQQILVDFPNDYPALFHCGLIEFSRSNYKRAIEYFERALTVQDELDTRDRRIPLATAYLQEKKFDKVVKLLQDEIPSNSDRGKSERLVLLNKAYLAMNDQDNAGKVIASLDSLKKDDPYVLEGLAQSQIDFGEYEQALINLELAQKQANESEKSYFAIILAEYHYQHKAFEKAVSWYESSAALDKDFPLINHYLISLLNSGYYEKANSLAKLFRKTDATNPLFMAIEAKVAEYIGELDYAKSLYLQLKDIDPENAEYLMSAALIDYRNGKNEDAFNLLKQNIVKFWNDPLALMTIAQIGASAKKNSSEFLEYAYRARRLGVNNPNIHLAYVGLFLGGDDSFDMVLDVEKVNVNVSVCVKTDSETKKWYTILSDEPVDKGRGEILVADPLAQKLIGLQKGDAVHIREGFYENLEFTVVEIKSKYISALHATLEEFSSLFPENLSLQMMKIEDGDPTKMIAFSARQNQITQRISDFYIRENLTVGQFSKLVGRNQIQTWYGLSSNSGFVKVSTGTSDEQEIYAASIKEAKNITLELTALLTLANIEQLYLLSERFENIYIAQTVLDIMTEGINSEQAFMKERFSIDHNQDRLSIHEIKENQIQQNITFLGDIRTFIQEKCKIIPVELALKLGKKKYEELVETLSTPSIDSILVAKQTETLLYSDDLVLRGFAKIEFDVNGVWTQPILQNCGEKGLVSQEAYHEAVAKLVFANYNYVSIKAETLVFYLEKNNWNIVGEVARLFQVLAGPLTSIESALQIAIMCVKEVWSKSLMMHQKNNILNLVLSCLVKNRLSMPTIQVFVNNIRKIYINSFTPWYGDEIIAHTHSWLQTHLSTNQKNLLY